MKRSRSSALALFLISLLPFWLASCAASGKSAQTETGKAEISESKPVAQSAAKKGENKGAEAPQQGESAGKSETLSEVKASPEKAQDKAAEEAKKTESAGKDEARSEEKNLVEKVDDKGAVETQKTESAGKDETRSEEKNLVEKVEDKGAAETQKTESTGQDEARSEEKNLTEKAQDKGTAEAQKTESTGQDEARSEEKAQSGQTEDKGAASAKEDKKDEKADKKKDKKKKPAIEVKVEGKKLKAVERTNVKNFLSLSKLRPEVEPSADMFAYYLGKVEKEAATALEPFGYYNAKIDVSSTRRTDGWDVLIKADPGEATRITTMDLQYKGEGAQEEPLLEAKARIEKLKGEVFNHSVYEQNKSQLQDMANELGYPKAHYETSRVEVRRSANTADVRMLLDTGIRHTVSDLNFVSEILDQALLERISPVHVGDPLSPRALTALRQTFYDSGYFSNVDVSYDVDTAQDGKVPVTVDTTPAARHRYGFGVGYGTDTGARVTLEYANRYLNRRGHQLDVRLRPSQRLSTYSAQYAIPIGDPKRDKLYLNTNFQTESFENIDATTWLSKLIWEHNWDNFQISAYLQYLDEDYDTGLHKGTASLFIPGISASWVMADNRINTKHGIKVWASLEGSSEPLLSTTSFIQLKAGTKAIVTPLENWRIIGRGQLGMSMMDDLDDLPVSLRFFAGGDQSVRGYGYKKISPRDSQGGLLGGKQLLAYSVELERMLAYGVALAAFYDAAAVMNSFNQYRMDAGMGFGLHWNAPFGQLRVDLGVPTDDVHFKSVRLHVTLGTDL